MMASALTLPLAVFANNEPQVEQAPVVQAVPIQNPYEAACHELTELDYKNACYDAAHGTVVVLRNSNQILDPVRDGFLSSVKKAYGSSIPVEFRDTEGQTTMFMFDKNMRISSDMLVNGSVLFGMGEIYQQKGPAIGRSLE